MKAFEASLAAGAAQATGDSDIPGLARANGSESMLAALLRKQNGGPAPEIRDTHEHDDDAAEGPVEKSEKSGKGDKLGKSAEHDGPAADEEHGKAAPSRVH